MYKTSIEYKVMFWRKREREEREEREGGYRRILLIVCVSSYNFVELEKQKRSLEKEVNKLPSTTALLAEQNENTKQLQSIQFGIDIPLPTPISLISLFSLVL
jgi:hypothetical protein